MLDDSGHRREAYHLYEVPNQVKLTSGDRGQKSSDLGRGPRSVCRRIGNSLYFDLNGVNLAMEICKKPFSRTLKIYILYYM